MSGAELAGAGVFMRHVCLGEKMYAKYADAAGDSAGTAVLKAEARRAIDAMRGLCPRYAEAARAASKGSGLSAGLEALAREHVALLGRLEAIDAELRRAAAVAGGAAALRRDVDERGALLEARQAWAANGARVLARSPVRCGFSLGLSDCGAALDGRLEAWTFVMCPGEHDDRMHYGVVLPVQLDDGRWVVYVPRGDGAEYYRCAYDEELHAVPSTWALRERFGDDILTRGL